MKTLFGAAILAAVAGVASADIAGGNLEIVRSGPANQAFSGSRSVTPGATYSNVTNYTGFTVNNGGQGTFSGNTITAYLSDDIHMVAAQPTVTGFKFTMSYVSSAPLDPAQISIRPRVRFHQTNGASGGPGSYITGFTFNPITIGKNQIFVVTGTTAAFALPQNFWMGICFDNNANAAGAPATAMSKVGIGFFDPIDLGSSADKDFYSGANVTGTAYNVNNPGGTVRTSPFAGAPLANYGWEIIPSPSSLALLGMGGLIIGRRRR